MVRRMLLWSLVLTALTFVMVPCAHAQEEIVGDWEGIIAGQLKMVFHISENDGELSATLDVPAQSTAGLPMNEVTFEDGKLRMTLGMVGGVFEGILKDDGTIEGEWTQSAAPQPQALNLARVQTS